MPSFRLYRMKESARQQFRWSAHTIGVSSAKPRDYEAAGSVEAANPYAVWLAYKDNGNALGLGDILESESGELRIYKYVGFEEAQWQHPEAKTVSVTAGEPDAG